MKGRPFLAALVVGLCARAGLLVYYLRTHHWSAETWEHEAIAQNLLAGKGFVFPYHHTLYRSFGVPLYPVVCAALHAIGGPGLRLYFAFNLLTAAATMAAAFGLSRHLLDRRAAAAAAWLMALEPSLIIYQSYKVEAVALAALLLLLSLRCFFDPKLLSTPSRCALAGVAAGIGILTRADLIGALAALPWALGEIQGRRAVAAVGAVLGGTALVMAPWQIRNYEVHGRFIAFSTTSPELLWQGNNPNSTGTQSTADGRPQFDAAPEDFQRRIESSSELEQADLFKAEALRYIKAEPRGFLRRTAKKFFCFLWFTPTYATANYDWLPAPLRTGYKFFFGLILVLAGLGLGLVLREADQRQRRIALGLLAAILAIDALHSPNYVEGRHRVLVTPILLIFAARGWAAIQPSGVKSANRPNRKPQTASF